MADEKTVNEPVNLDKKEEAVVVNINVTEMLKKKEDEFNQLAAQIKQVDEQIRKANETLNAERNRLYTRAVEIQGTIKDLRELLPKKEEKK